MGKWIEEHLEIWIFSSRWILAPFYIGLVGALVVLLIKFLQSLLHTLQHVLEVSEQDAVMEVLGLIDISLAANLTLIVIFAGYENFVSKLDFHDHKDRPSWMGQVDFSRLKLKLLASIVAISAIQLLKAFIAVKDYTDNQLAWMVAIHMSFVISGVLLAVMDRLNYRSK